MRAIVATLLFAAWGFEHPHKETAFIGAPQHLGAPADEKMGPNMNFSPISTTMKCVISLTIQYMLLYTALGICRTYVDMTTGDHKDSAVQQTLQAAAETTFYAPMVCLMFIGTRMRVLQLTKGQGNPQEWVQMCMVWVTYSILFSTCCVLLAPVFADKKIETDPKTGELKADGENPFKNDILALLFTVLRYVSFFALYCGFAGVCVGVFLFEPPKDIWSGAVPPVSPAVACTMTLSIAFFGCYLFVAISRTYTMFVAGSKGETKFGNVMKAAADTMAMAPMLCVLFLGARMRALQMDPVSGNPQRWAQNCFYLCTYALIAQTCVAIFVPLLLDGKAEVYDEESPGDMKYTIGTEGEQTDTQKIVAKVITGLRFLIMLSVYGGAVAVVCSVFTIEHPKGPEHTPPLSPTMQCVTNLASQYFFIYLLLWIFFTVKDFLGMELTWLHDAMETAKTTVQFAPMISVLFIATRMRALQISKNQGSPQGWAQDGMYLCSWALLVQFLMCLLVPIFTGGKKYQTDSLDGKTKASEGVDLKVVGYSVPAGHYIVETLRYTALLALLGGITTVIVSVFLITPETANGRGSIPVIADGTLGYDLGPAPGPLETPLVGDHVKGGMESVGTNVGAAADVAVSPVSK